MRKSSIIVLLTLFIYNVGLGQIPVQTQAPLQSQMPFGLSIETLGVIQVDQLSDQQVSSFMNQIQSSGMSQQQLELMAKSRGMSPIELEKLKRRFFELNTSGASAGGVTGGRMRSGSFDARQSSFLGDNLFTDSLGFDIGPEIFGTEIFENVKLSFEPSLNIPIPENYQIGPGDKIIVDIWGASENTYNLQLSPEGYIHVPSIGPIHVSGLTLEAASKKVISKLTNIYSGLEARAGRPQNTYAQVTLGNLRSVKVHVVGEVKYPGTFNLSSLSSVFNALYYAGGPTEYGSLRTIQVLRGGENVASLDVYDFLVNGTQEQNIRLKDQDVVLVTPYLKRVLIDGEVKRPGIYESKEGESIGDLLVFAGGFAENAYSHFLSIRRNTGREMSIVTVNKEDFDSFTLNGGDQILVETVSERYVNRVQIVGSVYRNGEFELTDGLTLKGLIERADGLKGDAFLGRGLIVRMEDDYTLSTVEFDVKKVLNGSENIVLQNEDIVHIKSIFDLREEYSVTIEGEVKNPGAFEYVKDMTVEDLILMADGLKESASKSSVEVARRIKSESVDQLDITAEVETFSISDDLSLSEEASTFKLEPFDLVIIRRTPTYEEQLLVEMEGEVIYPGKYSLTKKNERISDLMKRAGGLTPFGYPGGATLIRRTEFYLGNGSESANGSDSQSDDPEEIRRQRLKELGGKALKEDEDFKTHQFIGIDLGEILNKPGSKLDLILQEGDILSVPRQLQTVRLSGEVLYPITTRHDDSFSFKDYISHAGGFSLTARKNKAYVVYANGSAERTKSFLWFKNYPRVEPGAEIFVPDRPERRRLSAGEIAGLATSFLSLILLINTVVDTTSN